MVYVTINNNVILNDNEGDVLLQVDAVVSLRNFFEELEDKEALKPVLPQIMDAIFHLMHQVSAAAPAQSCNPSLLLCGAQ